jgi:DNA-directed RNA polymerase III, subunit C34
MDSEGNQDDNAIALKIVQLCKDSGEGIQDDHLARMINVSEEKRMILMNQLIAAGYIKVDQTKEGTLLYKFQDPEEARKFAGLDRDAMIVYEILKKAGSQGLTNAELKKKSELNKTLDSILKTLEKRGLIKSLKSVNQKNRKIYMLQEYEPTDEITGGLWYRNNEFYQELVDAIYNKTLKYIESQNTVSKKEIGVFLRSANLAQGDLKDEHVQSIINILLFDDKIEELPSQMKGNPIYRISEWDKAIKPSVYTLTPCGTCPVFNECKEGSIISPEKCIYFPEW